MGFHLYWILLIVSGALMLTMAASGFGQRSRGDRIVNVIFGLGFLGYGVYLGFIFTTGHYWIFIYAFVVPILMIVNAIKNSRARKVSA